MSTFDGLIRLWNCSDLIVGPHSSNYCNPLKTSNAVLVFGRADNDVLVGEICSDGGGGKSESLSRASCLSWKNECNFVSHFGIVREFSIPFMFEGVDNSPSFADSWSHQEMLGECQQNSKPFHHLFFRITAASEGIDKKRYCKKSV